MTYEESMQKVQEKMKEMGCQASQMKLKTLPIIVSILCDNPELLQIEKVKGTIAKLESKINEKESEIRWREGMVCRYQEEIARLEPLYDALKKLEKEHTYEEYLEKRYQEIEEYVSKYYASIETCDTQEGRDAIRRAQLFVNTVKVDTKYDNTAFIIGLASILNCGNAEPIDALRTINTRIPTPCEYMDDSFTELKYGDKRRI